MVQNNSVLSSVSSLYPNVHNMKLSVSGAVKFKCASFPLPKQTVLERKRQVDSRAQTCKNGVEETTGESSTGVQVKSILTVGVLLKGRFKVSVRDAPGPAVHKQWPCTSDSDAKGYYMFQMCPKRP